MNDIQIFSNEQFGQVRVIDIDGEGWLVGKDVAIAVGYNRPSEAIRQHCDEDDTLKHRIMDGLGIKPAMTKRLDEDDRIKHPITDNLKRVQETR